MAATNFRCATFFNTLNYDLIMYLLGFIIMKMIDNLNVRHTHIIYNLDLAIKK